MQRVTINLNKISYSPLLLPLFLLIGVMNIIVYLQLLIFLSYFIVYSCSKSNFRNYKGKSEILQLNASPKEWCQYLQTNPEPQLILYNRLAKCGSTTMENLFRIMSSRKKSKLQAWSAPSKYWIDMANSTSIRNSFIESVIKKSANISLIVDGHWEQYPFSKSVFQGKTFESIQLVRDCISRRRSMFFYSMFNSRAMTVLKKTLTADAFQEAQKAKLHTDDLDACFHDYACLNQEKNNERFSSADAELKMLCGSACKRQSKDNQTQGALANARNPSSFTVIGSLSRLSEYLEMLECAYPRALGGIRSVYDRTEVSL